MTSNSVVAAELLCWCHAVWGLTTPAIDGRERLCAQCLDSTRAQCASRHYADALSEPPPPQPASLFDS